MAERGDRLALLVEEWKEARNSVARFDERLVSLRKYGFTLATIMIATDAYLTTSVHIAPWAKAGAAIVVMALIFALFLLDERLKLLRENELERAVEVERQLGVTMLLCTRRQQITEKQKWAIKYAGVMTYIFFLAAAGGVGAISVLTTGLPESASLALHRWLPTAVVSGLCVVVCLLTIIWDERASQASRTGIREGYDRSIDKLTESRKDIRASIGKGYGWSKDKLKESGKDIRASIGEGYDRSKEGYRQFKERTKRLIRK